VVPTNELEGFSKRSRLRLIAYVVLGLAAAVGIGFALRPAEERPLPSFSLARLEGDGAVSKADLAGNPAVLNFWASWCIPCQEEAPDFERAWREFKDDGVQFIGINIQDTEDNARRFVEKFDITYPIVRDPRQELADALGVFGLPQTFFVDASGELFSVKAGEQIGSERGNIVLGAISFEELSAQIEAMLAAAD
jgi:cytochrome c biogenesis protein CcmG/thiol:disulfide interchange protein DsbE